MHAASGGSSGTGASRRTVFSRGLVPLVLAGVAASWSLPAQAWYVRFTANLGAFAPGLPTVQNTYIDTGEVMVPSVTQPLVVVEDVGGTGSASASVEGEVSPGLIRVRASGSALNADLTNANYAIEPYQNRPSWSDTLTFPTGGTFRFTLTLHSRVSGGPTKGEGMATTPGAQCSSNMILANFIYNAPAGILSATDELCDGNQGWQTFSQIVDLGFNPGQTREVYGNVGYFLFGNSNSGVSVGTEIDAFSTVRFNVDPVTPGATYTTASGVSYETQVLDDKVATLILDSAGGGGPALVVALDNYGTPEAYVKRLADGSAINLVPGTAGLDARDAAIVSDQNNDGTDDIAWLLDDTGAAVPKVEIRDTLMGKKLGTINLNSGHEGIALAVIADQNGNQSEEVVVLAREGLRGRLLIRDLVTKVKVNTISVPKTFEVLDLAMQGDTDGNGAPEALILAKRRKDDRGYVLVWDIEGALVLGKRRYKLVHVRLPQAHTPVAHTPVIGPGRAPAVAVASIRDSDGVARLFVYDTTTGDKLWVANIAGGRVPLAVRAFETAGGARRLALLTQRTSDQRPIVALFDVATGNLLTKGNVSFDSGQEALDIVITPDLALDAGAQPELGVLVQNVGLRVRDTVSKQLLETIQIP